MRAEILDLHTEPARRKPMVDAQGGKEVQQGGHGAGHSCAGRGSDWDTLYGVAYIVVKAPVPRSRRRAVCACAV